MKPLTVEQVAAIAARVLEKKREIEALQQEIMLDEALVFEVIGRRMFAAGQREVTLNNITFLCGPPEEREYCRCHHSLVTWCPTPHAEREVYLATDGLPNFWMKEATAKCGRCGKSSVELARHDVCPTCERFAADNAA